MAQAAAPMARRGSTLCCAAAAAALVISRIERLMRQAGLRAWRPCRDGRRIVGTTTRSHPTGSAGTLSPIDLARFGSPT